MLIRTIKFVMLLLYLGSTSTLDAVKWAKCLTCCFCCCKKKKPSGDDHTAKKDDTQPGQDQDNTVGDTPPAPLTTFTTDTPVV